MNFIHLIIAELKAIVSKPHNIVVMVAVMCVPLLYAGMFLYSFWDAFGKTGNLPVAVVNQDNGAEIAGKQINAGSDLVKNLRKNTDFKWQFVSEKEAQDGFKNNHYFMTVRIPASFSKNATTLMDQQLKPANIDYRINADYNFISSRMADMGLLQLKDRVSNEITKTYAQSMYAQINQLTGGLKDAANGSKTLASGSKKEVDGLNTLKSGFKDMMNGTNKLADGSGKLASGASSLNDGLKQAADGTNQLYAQTSSNSGNVAKLADGANNLADKLDQLNKGAAQLASGSGQLTGGSQSLTTGMNQYLAGLNQFEKGMQREKDGLDQLNNQLAASKPQIANLSSQMSQLTDGINQVNSGTNQLADGVSQLADNNTGIPKLYSSTLYLQQQVNSLSDQLKSAQAQNPQQLVDGLKTLTDGIQTMKTQVTDPATAAALGEIQKNISDDLTNIVHNEATNSSQILDTINSDSSLTTIQKSNLTSKIGDIQTAEQQATGSLIKNIGDNLTTLNANLSNQTTNLTNGLDQFLAGLNGGNGQLGVNAGVSQLVSGQQAMADGIIANGDKVTLQSGVNQLAGGVAILRNNIVGVPGQNGMNNGNPSLNLGAQELKKGSNTLADQVNSNQSMKQMTVQLNQLFAGVSKLDNGMAQLNNGQQSLQSNFVKLKDGEDRLSSGMKTLQSNLAKVPGATKALGNGASQLAAGNNQLNQTWPQLVSGIQSLQSGTNQLVSGSNQLATNMDTLNNGLSSLSNGQKQLSNGTNQLTSGAQKIYDGNTKLGSSLSDAHSQLAKTPTNNAHATKFSQPVTAIDGSHQSVNTFGSGFAPYFISLGLYVGALLLTIIYDLGKPAGVATGGWNIALSKFFITILMSIGQALLIDVVVLMGLGLHVNNPAVFIGFTILTSMSFMAIIQWLAGSFNNEGRFACIVILIFQLVTSGGAYAIELIPKWLQSVSHVLPMTYSVNGFRNIIDGHQHQMFVQNTTALVVFVLAGLVLSIITFSIKFYLNQDKTRSMNHTSESSVES